MKRKRFLMDRVPYTAEHERRHRALLESIAAKIRAGEPVLSALSRGRWGTAETLQQAQAVSTLYTYTELQLRIGVYPDLCRALEAYARRQKIQTAFALMTIDDAWAMFDYLVKKTGIAPLPLREVLRGEFEVIGEVSSA